MTGIIRNTIFLLLPWFAGPAWAVSIYDVIELSRQDYSDEEVVKIIHSTRSVFDLTAEDIPRLKNLGVSEAVIRAMLAAVPTPREVSADNDPPQHDQATAAKSGPNQFSVRLVSEEASGAHQHAYLTLDGLPILIFRDEGHFSSIRNRGEAVARNLEYAARAGEGSFQVRHVDGENVIVYRSAQAGELRILSVNHHDVHAYDVRSEPLVTAELLAAYWADLLNDYWAIAFLRQSPSRLASLHRGDALALLFKFVSEKRPGEPVNLGAAVQQLPDVVRRHLQSLAQAVPDDFELASEATGEAL